MNQPSLALTALQRLSSVEEMTRLFSMAMDALNKTTNCGLDIMDYDGFGFTKEEFEKLLFYINKYKCEFIEKEKEKEKEQNRIKLIKEQALAKLTEEEREILGLNIKFTSTPNRYLRFALLHDQRTGGLPLLS